MSTKKITALTELSATPATTDMIPIVDVSDTTDAATGTTKKISALNVGKASIVGIGIGAGNTTAEPVKIDTSSGEVGIGTDAPDTFFHIEKSCSGIASAQIRLTEPSDAREVSILNNAGDLTLATHGTDNATDGKIVINEGGAISFSTGSDDVVDMTIATDSNVGIGATAPSHALHVADSAYTSTFERFAGAAAGGPGIIFAKSRGSSAGSYTIAANNDDLGSLSFKGADGNSWAAAASINGQVDGTPGDGDMPGRLTFSTTADGAETATERMRIDSSGKVIIGLAVSGQDYLTVSTPGGGGLSLARSEDSAITSGERLGELNFAGTEDSGANWGTGAQIKGFASESWAYGSAQGAELQFFTTDNTTATLDRRMTIDNAGNMLLGGTATPASSVGNLCLFNGTAPSGSVTNGVVLYAQDVSTSELKVRDEAGNVSTLSPHNFELLGERSEPMAWSYANKNVFVGKEVNVDMMKVIRALEKLTGEEYIKIKDIAKSEKLDWATEEKKKEAEQKKEIDAYKAKKAESDAHPTDSSTKAEIKAYLDKCGIDYTREDIQKTEKVDKEITETEEVKEGSKWIRKEITKTVKVSKEVFEDVDVYDEAGKVKVGTRQVPVMVKAPELSKEQLLNLVPEKEEFTEVEPAAYSKKAKPAWIK